MGSDRQWYIQDQAMAFYSKGQAMAKEIEELKKRLIEKDAAMVKLHERIADLQAEVSMLRNKQTK